MAWFNLRIILEIIHQMQNVHGGLRYQLLFGSLDVYNKEYIYHMGL